ncbi:DNA alkylation repair protein [Rubrivivax gelatinosus]|nr:DNA alkylation repair protein [Rubrivivax gelatinosus]
MAEPFKNFIDRALVERMAARLAAAGPGFDTAAFVRLAGDGLEALELKARTLQLCAALEATLPADFAAAADRLDAAMAGDDGLASWALWPVGEFVARRGLATPERALATLHRLTQRFTAEFAIRPFIVAHPALVYTTLSRWAEDPDENVRRLASEGTRPRLPWGQRLAALVADPAPNLPLLRRLQDDPSEFVRRSVANHLNDIAKDHPALVVDWVREQLPGAGTERLALLRHASRTLVKQGDAAMLALWGHGRAFDGNAALVLAPTRLAVGDTLALSLTLASRASTPQRLVVDYRVHHVKADGRRTAKVFKGWKLELAPGASVTLARRHSMKPVTTRRYFAGAHRVDIQVNGSVVAGAEFELAL